MKSEPCTLKTLVEKEIGRRPRAVNEKRVTEPSGDLYGISLSGGGIRSATFNLGLLQGLHHFKLLDKLDYLSTISGGGYVGSFWSAWRARNAADAGTSVFPDGTGSDGRPEPDPVRHLREFGNFLAPRMGVLSWDTGRILVSLVSSFVPSLLTALSVIALAVLTWCLTAYGLFALGALASTLILVGITTVLLVVTELVWRRRQEETDWWAYGEAVAWGLFCSGFAWWILHLVLWQGGSGWYGAEQRLPVIRDEQEREAWLYLLTPVVPWVVASLAMSIRRWLGSAWVRDHVQRVRRNSFDRVHARVILAAFIWMVIAVLWWIGALVGGFATEGNQPEVTTGLVGSTGIVVWLFSRIQKRLSTEAGGSLGTGWMARLKPILPQAMAYLAVGLLVVATVAGIVAFDRSDFTYDPPIIVAATSALILVLSVLLFNPNEIGLHTFYRARISRAYLGASNPDPEAWRKTEERKDDDTELTDLSVGSPCHLICCAANDLASRELGSLDRGAESAVLSRIGLTVGERCRFWNDDHPTPTLSAAATASAAAFNPLMGGMSKKLGPAVTFLMAAFNLRLGLWLPGVSGTDRHKWIERRLIGLPFLKEMFGLARADGRHVHLSDGGHFENMALYELIRRHCRFIIASDCGMDPTVSFDDFGNVVRRVRADFGVDVRIDLSPLRPGADGRSRQVMVAGDIHYPEGDTGILLLFKPGLTGTEPADIAQYGARNVLFPHESTTDQFYDEAQWEAYRRLGEHAVHVAFRHVSADLDAGADAYAPQVFLRARREGQAVPEGYGDRLSHFSDRIAELDQQLRHPECSRLLREVYKEIDDLGQDEVTDAGAAGTRPPAAEDLAASLHLIRRALLFLQEVYTTENLEENYHHPLYLGLVNYFARWTSAPLFRLWWPLLKTMYPQPFTRFVERRYGVRAGERRGEPISGAIGRLSRDVKGFAMRCWKQSHAEPLKDAQSILPFMLRLTYMEFGFEVQAAQVVVIRSGPDLIWDAGDFYVPPGLWGIGIGGSFLRRLRGRQGEAVQDGPDRFRSLYVRICIDPGGGTAAKKSAANEMQLYRSAGFHPIDDSNVPKEVREHIKLRDPESGAGPGSSSPGLVEEWMVAPPPDSSDQAFVTYAA